jgi:hypothetical protein
MLSLFFPDPPVLLRDKSNFEFENLLSKTEQNIIGKKRCGLLTVTMPILIDYIRYLLFTRFFEDSFGL